MLHYDIFFVWYLSTGWLENDVKIFNETMSSTRFPRDWIFHHVIVISGSHRLEKGKSLTALTIGLNFYERVRHKLYTQTLQQWTWFKYW